MALEGMNCRQIATQLKNERVPTPTTYAGLLIASQEPYASLHRQHDAGTDSED